MIRSTNRNYGTIGGGAASQPFFQSIGTTANMNFLDPLGRVDFDSLQVSVNRRFADGLAFTGAYTLAKGTDAWATGILIPEYRYLNEGPAGNVSPNKLDLSASYQIALRHRQALFHRRYCRRHPRRLAAQRVLHGVLRFSYDNHRQRRVVERAGQPAARRRSEGFQRVGGRRAGQPVVRYDIVRARRRRRGLAHPKRTDIAVPDTRTSMPVSSGRSASHRKCPPSSGSRRSM